MSLWVVVAEEEEEDPIVVIVVEGIVITMAMAATEIVTRRSIGEKFVNVYHSTKQYVKHLLMTGMAIGMAMAMGMATVTTDTVITITTVIKNAS
ncbi:hypothetical protein NW801_01840 [Brevibacillus laterosporus]|uniref:Uncharacterized protein n=2 Tax=Brevibacillus TaxID=55080 RepID=A0ABT4HS89_9BACL|nr:MULTISPECIES: hypothetical protein [Brevibacillus]MCR8983818.1 hypothetical protein [Brevibacillus laterosporus]MCZ0829537.1 hypothetical protein [Brevibacillus halotolerans]